MIIGIDMGGTNIDGVAVHEGQIVRQIKRPVDRSDYFHSIWNCIKNLLWGVKEDIERINSAQLSRLMLSENRISKVGVILQRALG